MGIGDNAEYHEYLHDKLSFNAAYGLREATVLTGMRELGDTPRYVGKIKGDFMSWVVSAKQRDSVRERDESWPEDSAVYLKSRVTAGDQEMITQATYHAQLVTGTDGRSQDLQTEFLLHRASLATAAVMTTGFEGSAFEDPDTGQTLIVSGDINMRLEQIRRLPQEVISFIDRKVGEMNNDPLAQKPEENVTKKESTRRSIRS